jgi:hypothetical protein
LRFQYTVDQPDVAFVVPFEDIQFLAYGVETIDVVESRLREHLLSQRGEFGAIAGLFADDEEVAVMPVLEEIVEQQPWSVGWAMSGLGRGCPETVADWEEVERVVGEERDRVKSRQGAEDVEEVLTGCGEDAVLEWGEVSGGEGEGVFVDGDYGGVGAEKEPGPDANAVWERGCWW